MRNSTRDRIWEAVDEGESPVTFVQEAEAAWDEAIRERATDDAKSWERMRKQAAV